MMLGSSLSLPILYRRRAMNPASLFAGGEDGALWPAHDASAVFTTHDGDTLATPGDAVGRIENNAS